jgi:HSP20 family molecular chaperone IbpA
LKPPAKRREKTPGAPRNESGFPFRLSVDGDKVFIVAELPGIREEKIRLDLGEGTLIISAVDGERSMKRRISLPWVARLAAKKFGKGILELTLERSGR